MNKDIRFLTKSLIAHRGMYNNKLGITENSIIAFQKAIENLYIIELDIHLLKDNSIVVFHDDNLKRMTGIDKKLNHCTYNEIKDLKLNKTNYKIPLLEDVLKLINGKVPIIIEFKYDSKTGWLEKKAMEILKNYTGKYVVKSFNPISVLWFKKNYPKIIRGQLSSNFSKDNMNFIKKFFLKNMIFNFITKPDFISYDIDSLPNKKIEKLRANTLILTWTIKNNFQLQKAKKYSDNYICENLEHLDKN